MLFVVVSDLKELPVISWRKVKTTSSQHAPYVLGDTRATMVRTNRYYLVKGC